MTPHGIILLKSLSQGGPLNSEVFFAHGQVFADDSFDRQFLPFMLFLSSPVEPVSIDYSKSCEAKTVRRQLFE